MAESYGYFDVDSLGVAFDDGAGNSNVRNPSVPEAPRAGVVASVEDPALVQRELANGAELGLQGPVRVSDAEMESLTAG